MYFTIITFRVLNNFKFIPHSKSKFSVSVILWIRADIPISKKSTESILYLKEIKLTFMWSMSNIYSAIQSHFSGVSQCRWREEMGGCWMMGTDSDVDKCQKQTSQTFKMSHEMNFVAADGIDLRNLEIWWRSSSLDCRFQQSRWRHSKIIVHKLINTEAHKNDHRKYPSPSLGSPFEKHFQLQITQSWLPAKKTNILHLKR